MSKILCDSNNIVRFYFDDNDSLIEKDGLLLTPYQNIGSPIKAQRTFYYNVILPNDIDTKQYIYDGNAWTQNPMWQPDQ